MAKKKFMLEFDMRGTPQSMLWMYVATPSGLDQWFADEVEQDGKKFTFYWDKYPTEAMLLSIRSGERAKYRWVGDDDKSYFEFKITVSELTGHTLLTVVDFADADEEDESKALWEKQLKVLKRKLGC
jgi:uncharacterized protein YndB with AHSA1/START domain